MSEDTSAPDVIVVAAAPREGDATMRFVMVGEQLALERDVAGEQAPVRFSVQPGLVLDEVLRRLGTGVMPDDALWALWAGLMSAMSGVCTMHRGPLPTVRDYHVDIHGTVTALVVARDHSAFMPSREMMEDIRENRWARESSGAQTLSGTLSTLMPQPHSPLLSAFQTIRAGLGGDEAINTVLGRAGKALGRPRPRALGDLVTAALASSIQSFDEAAELARLATDARRERHRQQLVVDERQRLEAIAIAEAALAQTGLVACEAWPTLTRTDVPTPRTINPLLDAVDDDLSELRMRRRAPMDQQQLSLWPWQLWRHQGSVWTTMAQRPTMPVQGHVWLACAPAPLDDVAVGGLPLGLALTWDNPGRAGALPDLLRLVGSPQWPRPCPVGVPLAAVQDRLDPDLRGLIVDDVDDDLEHCADDEAVYWAPGEVSSIHLGTDGVARVLAPTARGASATIGERRAVALVRPTVPPMVRRFRAEVRAALGVVDDPGSRRRSVVVTDALRQRLQALVQQSLDPAVAEAHDVAADLAVCDGIDLSPVACHLDARQARSLVKLMQR